MILPYCVYVLKSQKDLENYTGYSTRILKRIKEHNNGKSKSTADRTPFELIYCEFHRSMKDAKRREKYLKSNQGRRMLKFILRNFLDNS
ncbi:GIY-YIG nuclease family protein [Hyphobacterium sp. CCMP332]|nr:GIY-YIG nuclease family protein [Hyphobacterium sp. CCMP332]